MLSFRHHFKYAQLSRKNLADKKLGGREIQELESSAQRITAEKGIFDSCLQDTLKMKMGDNYSY